MPISGRVSSSTEEEIDDADHAPELLFPFYISFTYSSAREPPETSPTTTSSAAPRRRPAVTLAR
jgi:hypothetical protein